MNNENIKISIITPCFNDEKFISETIRSILYQTHKNFELIIVDDCSTDNTVGVIKTFNDDRIKLFVNKKNCGAAYCRNLAIKESTGDYIAFLDGDDIWLPTKLEDQLDFMVHNNYSFTHTNYSLMDEEGEELGLYFTGPKKVTHRKFLQMSFVGCLTVMYKKSVYPDLNIPDDIYKRNDYALWLKLSEKVPCYLLNKTLSKYRKRKNNSISSSNRMGLIKKHKELFQKLYGYGKIRSTIRAYINVLAYIWKEIRFKKRIKS